MTRKMDPKVCHNKCVINYYQSGLRATDDFMHNLSRVCDMVGSVPVHFFTLISVVRKFLILKEKITQKQKVSVITQSLDQSFRQFMDANILHFYHNVYIGGKGFPVIGWKCNYSPNSAVVF